ncbi:MAG: TonB-dependent receptor [Terricaulis sp.]
MFAAFAYPAAASGQESNEPIIVTGSRISAETAASETAIDAADIERLHPTNVGDLIGLTPSVTTFHPGGSGASELFLRGAESNFTVVTIDGVRMNDPSHVRGGGYDFSTIDTTQIERIEIMRGGASAIHGSDAIAGVVAITTAAPSSEASANLNLEYGGENRNRVGFGLTGALASDVAGRGDYVQAETAGDSGARQELNALSARIDADGDGALSGSLGVRLTERSRRGFPDVSGGPLYAASSNFDQVDARDGSAWATLSWRPRDRLRFDLVGSFYRRDEEIISPAIAAGVFDAVPASISDTRFERTQLTLSGRSDINSALRLGAGFDIQAERAERLGELDLGFVTLASNFDLERTFSGAFAEAELGLGDNVETHLALRFDDLNGRSYVSGRASLLFRPNTPTRIRAIWANGVKAPSFYALGDSLVGNPDLRDETGETFELAAEFTTLDERLGFALTAFHAEYDDLVDFDFATFQLVNRATLQTTGLEVSLDARLSETTRTRLNVTTLDATLSDDAPLAERPELIGSFIFDWTPSARWDLTLSAQYLGERASSSIPTGTLTIAPTTRLDAALSYAVNSRSRLYVAIDNILDDESEVSAGFRAMGARARIGFRAQF